MQIKWQNRAISDLQHLQEYITQENPRAAQQVANRIIQAVDLLRSQPGMGRPGRAPNTRELIVNGTPYLLPYRVRNNVLEILRVLHGAMKWPDKF
jgi:toxin ParE1/3/4